VAIWTLGELGTHPVAQATSADLAPARSRGRYQGAYALNFSGATVVAPVLGGLVLDTFGARVLWWGCAGLCLLVSVLLALTARSRERRAAQVTAENEGRVAGPTAGLATPTTDTTPAPAAGAVQDLRVR